jgi:hypothetical protein
MDNPETGRIVDDLLGNAKYNYECQQWQNEYEKICQKLDDPALIQSKAEALNICDTILQWSIDKGAIPFGSVLHRLGMRLMDYLMRCDP